MKNILIFAIGLAIGSIVGCARSRDPNAGVPALDEETEPFDLYNAPSPLRACIEYHMLNDQVCTGEYSLSEPVDALSLREDLYAPRYLGADHNWGLILMAYEQDCSDEYNTVRTNSGCLGEWYAHILCRRHELIDAMLATGECSMAEGEHCNDLENRFNDCYNL